MEYRLFLGKYRVSTTKSAHWWETRRSHFGVIYEAEAIESGQKVALELIPAFLLGASEREELEKAARAARQIRHPNIPTFYDFGVEGEQFVSVTEYVGGPTANRWVAGRSPTPIGVALGIGLQVVSALQAAARYDLHHPAIYPGNLMIVPDRRAEGGSPLVKVLRFPGPRPSSRAFTLANPLLDDPTPFTSPEQITEGRVDFRSATYSLGATLWFLLGGTVPVAPLADLGSRTKEFAGLPESIGRLLTGMLAEDPEERPPDPSALEREIRGVLAEVDHATQLQPVVVVRPERPETPRRPRRERRLPMKVLAASAVVLLSAATLALLPWPELFRADRPRDSEANLRANQSRRRWGFGDEAMAKQAGSPTAMNFSVVAPSYQRDGLQIRELAPNRANGPATANRAELAPPAEGPRDPIVELAPKGKRAPRSLVAIPSPGQVAIPDPIPEKKRD